MAVMTSAEFCAKLKNIVNRPNFYWNSYPYNLGYYHGNQGISFDCWNLVKALINDPTIDQNYTIGRFAPASGNIPDWDGWNILNHCSDVSTDFSRLYRGSYLYMAGHAGIYIGSGLVVECTTDFGCDGVIISRITSNGGRYRDGIWGRSWSYNGKLTNWIDYSTKPENTIIVDGIWGPETTRAVQKVMKMEYPYLDVDGIISSQEKEMKRYLINADTDSWEFVDYAIGSPTICAIQNRLNQLGYNAGSEDGIAGPVTVSALQMFLNERGQKVGVSGYLNHDTVAAYQKFLNNIL